MGEPTAYEIEIRNEILSRGVELTPEMDRCIVRFVDAVDLATALYQALPVMFEAWTDPKLPAAQAADELINFMQSKGDREDGRISA